MMQPSLCVARSKDCLVFTLGAEWKLQCRSARRPRVRPIFSFVISSRLPPPLSSSLSTRPPAQDKPRMNHFPSHSHSLPLSPFLLICFSLFFILQATTIDSQPQQHGTSTPQNFL